ncbi:RNA polymerase factor sigma-54 [Methylocella sp.]|uniref:RNA polymerase factor sigma-54 n=1 Tax=Methylocella sp. TaxID=1978226 RepID=UPI0035AE1D2B
MALSAKLVMRQGQSLVMTPQLLQAIKLLQFSNMELTAFVEEELERNPLLERGDDVPEAPLASADMDFPLSDPAGPEDLLGRSFNEADEADWSSSALAVDCGALEASLGTELANAFDDDRSAPALEPGAGFSEAAAGLSATSWTGSAGGPADGEAPNLEAYAAAPTNLKDHLEAQLSLAVADPVDRLIGLAIIDSVDDAGYFVDDLADMAARLKAPLARVERSLAVIQTFEPSGVGARDLAECLAIQLREKDRFDPAMQALVANLPLLARRDFAALRRICGVDDEDLADMAAEIRRLDPKPGRAFGGGAVQPLVPDVIVRAAPGATWHVELNTDVLPRVLVNNSYAARVGKAQGADVDKSFMSSCLQTANWLTKSLEQRAKTILRVSSEIVRQQDGFFRHGVEHLRPLNLKTIAEAIGMHESTVSRVTSNKYMSTPRGLFELKYFFTASIASNDGGDAHSAESVRFRIRHMIDQERPDDILSDDAIVARLKEINIDIARRTVAKYRESLKIRSSVERRREKAHMAQMY